MNSWPSCWTAWSSCRAMASGAGSTGEAGPCCICTKSCFKAFTTGSSETGGAAAYTVFRNSAFANKHWRTELT